MMNSDRRYYDELISQAWFCASEKALGDLMKLVNQGCLSINYQHSKNGVSMMMAASFHGKLDFIKHILSAGGDPMLKV